MWWRKQVKQKAEGEGKKAKPTGVESYLHLFTLQTIVQIFCVRAWGRHLGFQEDVARGRPRQEPSPFLVGKVDGERACMHRRGEGCQGPCGAHREGSQLGTGVSNSSSVVGLE